MSYLNLDLSIFGGKPVELYRFSSGTQSWTFSSGPETELGGSTYAPLAINRTDIEDSNELNRSGVTISLDITDETLAIAAASRERPTTVVIFRKHSGDSEYVRYWAGRIMQPGRDGVFVTLLAEPNATKQRRSRRGRYHRLCGRPHYGSGCNLAMAEWAETATVTAVSGRTVTVSLSTARDDGWFSAGMIGIGTSLWLIYSHTGNELELMQPVGSNLAVGDTVTLYPGCARTREVCNAKFGNLLNCDAYSEIPDTNPFAGSIL